jgi:ribosomal protein S8
MEEEKKIKNEKKAGRKSRVEKMSKSHVEIMSSLFRLGFGIKTISDFTFLGLYRQRLTVYLDNNPDIKKVVKEKKKMTMAQVENKIEAGYIIEHESSIDEVSFETDKLSEIQRKIDELSIRMLNGEGDPKLQKVQLENFKTLKSLYGGQEGVSGTIEVDMLEENTYYVKRDGELVTLATLRDIILDKDAG